MSNLLLAGCGGGKESAPALPAPKPVAAMPGLEAAAAVPVATGSAPKPADAPPPIDFAAAGRQLNKDGQMISDLELLNQAIMSYATRTVPRPSVDPSKARSVSEAATLMAASTAGPPPLNSLSDLVKAGVIKSLPVPPPGKEYVLDARTRTAMLVDKK